MITKELTIRYTEVTRQELSADDNLLVQKAIEATQNAYTPYSQFKVGAAIRLSNGLILTGSNQENASFPATICAERSVLIYAHANYPEEKVCSIAIAVWHKGTLNPEPASPCGVCRQVLLETEKRAGTPVRVILAGDPCIRIFDSVKDLLPFGFDNF